MEPSYLRLWETGIFPERVTNGRALLAPCRLCPRQCRVDSLAGQTGFCEQGGLGPVAKALPHFERHPLTGEKGAGTVFFTGCALRCLYCQNYQISQEGLGEEMSTAVLADIFLDLQQRRCHNLDLVSPTPIGPLSWRPWNWPSPVVSPYRSSITPTATFPPPAEMAEQDRGHLPAGHEIRDGRSARTLARPRMTSQPDSRPRNVRQTGRLKTNGEGLAFPRLLVRHLVLPENLPAPRPCFRNCWKSPRVFRSVSWPNTGLSTRPGIIPGFPGRSIKRNISRRLKLVKKFGFAEVFIQDLDSSEGYFPILIGKIPFKRPEIKTRSCR